MSSLRSSRLVILGFFVLAGSGCEESTNTNTMAGPGEHAHAHEGHGHGPESLADALVRFDGVSFAPGLLRKHAESFSVERFEAELLSVIDRQA